MEQAWSSEDVYTMTMMTPISDLHGVGARTVELFAEAGLHTIADIAQPRGQERDLQRALTVLDSRYPGLGPVYWTRLASRCITVIERVRRADASPFVPDEYCCPMNGDWMSDPVVTPHGESYERVAIEKWITDHGTDPFTREPLALSQLYPNRKLKLAVENFRRNFHRFSVPFRVT
jgi:hypothetical protein